MAVSALLDTSLQDLSAKIELHLRCPKTHARVRVRNDVITGEDGHAIGSVRDGVAVMSASTEASFFDDKFEVMQRGHEREGETAFCYEQQLELLQRYLRPDQVILDIGCGPAISYEK